MATTARKSKQVVTGVTEAQYLESLAAYATADAKRNKILSELDLKITELREKYAERAKPYADECEGHFEVVQTFCEENKAQLFDKKRTVETVHGNVGFRLGTPKLKLMPKMNWEKVLDNLKHYLPEYVRTITEPAKDRLLADRDMEGVAEKFPKVGIMVGQDETFFIELKKED